MAKGDIWYLKDKNDNNRIIAKIEFTDDYCTGKCFEAYSWSLDGTPWDYHFVADFYCKWDGCTHWWFKGEDYDENISDSLDSYYHLCGAESFVSHVRMMCFAWKVSCMNLIRDEHYKNLKVDIAHEYFNTDTNALIKLMLEGYLIEKENDNK